MARRKKKQDIAHKDLLDVFRQAGHPLTFREIMKRLKAGSAQNKHVDSLLQDLSHKGKIIRSGKSYKLVERMPMVIGTLEVQRSGVGFVIPEDKRRTDVFISPDNFDAAWHGDRVMAAVLPGRRGKNPAGRIVRVLDRGLTRLTAQVAKPLGAKQFLAKPTDTRLSFNLVVDVSTLRQDPALGDILVAEPGEQLEARLWAARAEKLLGPEKDIEVQEAVVKTNHSIPTAFPRLVLEAAQTFPDAPSERDFADRKDARDRGFVTIDGAKARDFDDAVLVSPEKDGFVLAVAIADVSHYVLPDSPLDQEARERANSYYFPQSVEPMLPEALSNGLCSLNPDVDRLAVVAEMTFDASGVRRSSRFYSGVIRSLARLTYGQVKRALLDNDPAEQESLSRVMPMLRQAERLARLLQKRRTSRGSLDFDLPEPEILFNLQGETVDIRPKVRHFAHQIIEEFMIAANEAVAEFLRDREAPLLYRIHPEPDQDKVNSLFRLLERTSIGHRLPEEADIKGLQNLLDMVEGTDLEFLANRLLLRTMMQAKYSPENQGHFGLASECYCHFTSPIRRYADLVVHRALKASLSKSTRRSSPQQLTKVAEHLNTRERKAMQAEREIISRLTILFLEDRIGESFTGIVSSLSDFGFWVELNEVMAEGMIRLSSFHDDYYQYLPDQQKIVGERTGRTFSLGDQVRVVLEEVNLSRQEITLTLEEESSKQEKKGQKQKRRRK